MVDVLIRALVGWVGVSCLATVGWSVLVNAYKSSKRTATAEVRHPQTAETGEARETPETGEAREAA